MFLYRKFRLQVGTHLEEAAVNASSSIIATVESWDEHTTDMYFDGEHHYGVSTRHLKLQYRMNSKGVIYIDTDLTGELMQWVDTDGNTIGNGELSSSLSSARFEVSLTQETDSDNNIRRVIQCRAKQLNDSYSDYSGIYYDTCKPLEDNDNNHPIGKQQQRRNHPYIEYQRHRRYRLCFIETYESDTRQPFRYREKQSSSEE